MNDLLEALAAAGIVLVVDGDKIRYTAPAGAMTPELRQGIVAHKTELLEALTAPVADAYASIGLVDGAAGCTDCPHDWRLNPPHGGIHCDRCGAMRAVQRTISAEELACLGDLFARHEQKKGTKNDRPTRR
ncbi:MAG: hypothetical protein ACR2JY_04280 [Chloroflexota bacterium]